jgi:hypothetical protein
MCWRGLSAHRDDDLSLLFGDSLRLPLAIARRPLLEERKIMTTREHTPTPWHVYCETSIGIPDIGKPASLTRSDVYLQIAEVNGGNCALNAAFIVRACNSHAALVAALREAYAYSHLLPASAVTAIRAALKAAEQT